MVNGENNREPEQGIDKRPSYFAGQYLLEDDFQLEQKYHIDRQRRHNRLLHVSGIATGLKVEAGEGLKVKVTAGTAIDSQGRQVILLVEQNVDLVQDANNKNPILDGDYILSIRYTEELTDKQGTEEIANRRVQEKPVFKLSRIETKSESTPKDFIPLAKLTIKENKVEENIDSSVRQYSGICLPTKDGKGVTLRSHGDENSNLADLTGSLSISGTLEVTGHTQLNNTLTVTKETNIENKLTVKEPLVAESKIGIKNNNPSVELDVKGDIKATGKLTVGNVTITKGMIQKGGSQITTEDGNPDLGLYSQETGRALRFVTTQSDFYFSSAGGYGDAKNPILKLDKDGNLKVSGEIKGKIWYSKEYSVTIRRVNPGITVANTITDSTGQNVESTEEIAKIRMLPSKKSVAFLTHVQGQFNGDGERVWIEEIPDKNGEAYWYLCAQNQGGKNEYQIVKGKARCIGTDS